MLLDQSIRDSFNKPSTIVVFGSYPQKGHIHDKDKDALASFTRNRVIGLSPSLANKVVVITHYEGTPSIESSEKLLVLRIFQKNNPTSFYKVSNIFNELDQIKNILIEYEFSTFGDNQMTIAFIPFLISLRSKKVKITIELHQVLTNLEKLKGHLGYKDKDIRSTIFNKAISYFYKSIGRLADHIIVLEYHLKDRLAAFVPKDKIYFLPHGVQKIKNKPNSLAAKKELGFSQDDFVVLSFGYLTWYKGSDIFVNAANLLQHKKHIKFVLAGGQSHNQKHKPHYQKWYKNTLAKLADNPNIQHTDFVDEDKIGLYFQAADLVVFPYRTFMSSSGPLSLAFSYHRPFLLSDNLSPYLHSPDIRDSLVNKNLVSQITFQPNIQDLADKIEYFSKKSELLQDLKSISFSIAKKRSYLRLGKKQKKIILG